MEFKNIDINSVKELDKYFKMVNYEACEYCFTTLYMWEHVYDTKYYIGDNFAILMGEYDGGKFSIQPLASKENQIHAIDFIVNYFNENNKKLYLRGITKDVIDILKEKYPDRFEYIEERDLFDYIYDAESMKTLAGRKNQKKRNHINYFLKEYDNRFEYKLLDKEDFNDCIELVKFWASNKNQEEGLEESIDDELVSIKKVLDNYDTLKDLIKIAGIYIDGKLEAFTIGELLNDDMALIHIEKANPMIRGLYPYINQQFLVNEFPNIDFVNREEDLGIEGLRKAKLSYHPCRFVEKFTIKEI